MSSKCGRAWVVGEVCTPGSTQLANIYLAFTIHTTNLEQICGHILGTGNNAVNKPDIVPAVKEFAFSRGK